MGFETKDANDNVVTSEQILNGDGNVTIDLGDETHGKVIESFTKSAADASDGWREITIKTTALGAMSKTQDIIIKGTVTIGEGANQKTYELQRKVTITLTPRYTMQLVCNPNEIANTQGTPFDVVIKVPGDLRPSMFPLDFQLEAAAQSMTPDRVTTFLWFQERASFLERKQRRPLALSSKYNTMIIVLCLTWEVLSQ